MEHKSASRTSGARPVVVGANAPRSLARGSPLFVAAISLALTALIALLDFAAGPELSFAVFYLVPIALAAWFGARWFGTVVALLSGLAWVGDELLDLSHRHLGYFFWNSLARLALFVVVAHLLSALRARLLEASVQARSDPLTGLSNRRHLEERVQEELRRARRYRHPLALISIDIDDFKKVNDRFGHAAGDAVLRGVGAVLQGNVRQSDVAARLGGDEFVVLLVETGRRDAGEAAEKLRHALRAQMRAQGRTVTFSVGVVTFRSPPDDLDHMFQQVDRQLYRAKRGGKDQLMQKVVGAADADALRPRRRLRRVPGTGRTKPTRSTR